ncbi:MAG TPA: hypothetical protein VFF07_10675 [Actinomycetota bacterium]|nr:hypothetical protein [Actinomycetota bacterium]
MTFPAAFIALRWRPVLRPGKLMATIAVTDGTMLLAFGAFGSL